MHTPDKGKVRFAVFLEGVVTIWLIITGLVATACMMIKVSNDIYTVVTHYKSLLITYVVITILAIIQRALDKHKGPVMEVVNTFIISKMDTWQEHSYGSYVLLGVIASGPFITVYYMASVATAIWEIVVTVRSILYTYLKKI